MYRESNSALREQAPDQLSLLEKLVNALFMLGYFTLMPIIALLLLNWLAFAIAGSTWYQDFWMPPALLVLATFLGGVLIRQRMEEERSEMGTFILAMIALGLFAWLTQHDLYTGGDVYGKFLPKLLKYSIESYIYGLPLIGIVGMLFYKHFTVKTYN